MLSHLVGAGQAAWPEFAAAIDGPAFERYLAARLTHGTTDLAAGDLYLACACAAGVPAALEAFERQLLTQVPAFVRRIDAAPSFADEVTQTLSELLFVGAQPKIVEYSGRGPLAGWLRVVAVRLALKLRRKEESRPRPPSTSEPHSIDPEIAYLKEQYSREFNLSIEMVLRTLPLDERTLLKLYYLDGLTIEQIGTLDRVNASTVSRRLAAIRKTVLDDVRQRLQQRLSLSSTDLASLLQLVRSQLDISLPGLLRSANA